MAYVAHNVYANGINNEVLGGSNIYIALLSGEVTTSADLLTKMLAVSEVRVGALGANDTVNGSEQTGTPTANNKVGKFNNKSLQLSSISYNRTKSVEGDTNFANSAVNNGTQNPSKVATHFAVVKFTGTATSLVSYKIDNGGGSTTDVKFLGPNGSTAAQHEVLIVGNLTSQPTINADSNFMFGGATIQFTEA